MCNIPFYLCSESLTLRAGKRRFPYCRTRQPSSTAQTKCRSFQQYSQLYLMHEAQKQHHLFLSCQQKKQILGCSLALAYRPTHLCSMPSPAQVPAELCIGTHPLKPPNPEPASLESPATKAICRARSWGNSPAPLTDCLFSHSLAVAGACTCMW